MANSAVDRFLDALIRVLEEAGRPWSVLNNPELSGVLGGVSEVQLGDMEARRGVPTAQKGPLIKTRRESKRPPAFQEVIVLNEWDTWTLVRNVDQALIRSALDGRPISAIQRRLRNGNVEESHVVLVDPANA